MTKPRHRSLFLRRAGVATFVFAALAAAACSSSSNAPADAGPRQDGGDAHGPDAPATEDGGSDLVDGSDSAAPIVPLGLTLRLVSGRAALVGMGPNSCTNQPDASASEDRWCGFFVPSQTAGRSELWVVDATRAAAGADIRCDGSDARCLRLATDALHLSYAGGAESGFAGDTLFYRRGADANLIEGPVWAWRPGWIAGRELVTGSGTSCYAPPSRAVALCVRENKDVAAGAVGKDLLAGPLAPGDGPLPLVETVLLRSAADPAGTSSDFEFGFSPDGAYLAWSTVGAASSQGLKVQKVGDASPPLAVATGVSNWRISNDGKSWLWLRSFADDGLAPHGTLETAAFPAGTNVATLAASVGDFDLVGAGVLYRVGVADQVGDLRFMPDRAAPASSTLLDHGVRVVVTRSDDASTVVYSKTSTGLGSDLFAWAASLAAPCTLTSTPAALSTATIMAAGHEVVWAQRDVTSQTISGATTSLASCRTDTFAHDVLVTSPANDGRLLFLDDAPSGNVSGTLRAMAVVDGAAGPGTPLQRDVDAIFAPVATNAVLYTVSQGAAQSGLYVYAGPLLDAPPAPVDAGDAGRDGP